MKAGSSRLLVEIGVVGRAHGIAGAVHIFLHNPDSEILAVIDDIVLENSSGQRTFRIQETRSASRRFVVLLEGVSSRTAAEQLRGSKVLVPRDKLPTLSEDEFYVADLIGMEAWDNDKSIGIVTSSRLQGDVEMITVSGDSVAVEVPLVDDFVVKVDFDARKILLTDTNLLPSSPVSRNIHKRTS